MSLRFRLLLAVGVVALAALAIADVVTYQELRSFLYNRIDQSLEQSHMPIELALGSTPRHAGGSGTLPPGGNSPTGPGGQLPTNPPPRPTSTPSTTEDATSTTPPSCDGYAGLTSGLLHELQPGTFVEVRSASNAVLCRSTQPELGSSDVSTPVLPKRITGFASTAADFGEATVYFTAAGSDSDDAQYRIRASVLDGGPDAGGQLVVGVPLDSTVSILDRLVGVELAVTGAALVAALLLGWWLVRVSFRPLRAIEGTADAISAVSWPNGFRGRTPEPRSVASPAPSTPCWDASKRRSHNATPRNTSCGRRKAACASSWRTHRTSCARR